ncbi:response regulator transcription factor [Halomonas koreensis]|uniref:Response regulator n=1 Tax=Halomonas koreensis TaxID=245385 RepID=A0ABU1G3P8_9GAMM|nr:response regulator [Halomonas koreensis]MDR5867530.1 response regulator [Halomonas koreensis]
MPEPARPASRIAVVDDNAALRESLIWLLESVGLTPLPYADGEAFLADDAAPEVILLDVRMPGLSGLQVQRRLVERGDQTPLIFMTGHGDVPMAVTALQAGAFDFVEKPFNHQQLIDLVQRALAEHRQRRARGARLAALRDRFEALRPKEQAILVGVAEGLTSRQVAARLEISAKTVEIYRLRAMKALGAANLAELVRMITALGLVPPLPEA